MKNCVFWKLDSNISKNSMKNCDFWALGAQITVFHLTFWYFGLSAQSEKAPGPSGQFQIGLKVKNIKILNEKLCFLKTRLKNIKILNEKLCFLGPWCQNHSFSLSILIFLTFSPIWEGSGPFGPVSDCRQGWLGSAGLAWLSQAGLPWLSSLDWAGHSERRVRKW